MESLEELADMRVTELRDFLRRHGHVPADVPRVDGTPGVPRKGDLLLAAQQVWRDANHPASSPHHPQTSPSPLPPSSPQRPNPFQRNLVPSPTGPSSRRRLSVTPAQHQQLIPRPPGPLHTPTTATVNPPPPPTTTTSNNPSANRARRRSHVAINPAFSHLFTPEPNRPPAATPAAPNRLSGALNDPRVPPRRATLGPDGVPARPRIFVDADVHRVPDDHPPPAPPVRTHHRNPKAPVTDPVSPSTSRPLKETITGLRAPSLPKPNTPARPAEKRTKTHPSQPNPQRGTSGPSSARAAKQPSTATAPRFLSDSNGHLEGYDPEDDPDFDVNDEDDADSDDSFFGDGIPETLPIKDVDLVHNNAPSYESADLHYDSEHHIGGRDRSQSTLDEAMESDAGSTVETDDETVPDVFTDWSRRDLVHWLRSHDVPFPQNVDNTELTSRARGHALYLEANGLPSAMPKPAARREQSDLRRRGLSAPPTDVGVDDDVEIVAVHPAHSRSANARGPGPSKNTREAYQEHGKKRHVALFSILSLLAIISLMVAFTSLYHSINIPYCETVLHPGLDGKACRPCPKHGTCEDGVLRCESGYVDLGGRCAEDQEFGLYADTLAGDAANLLATVAGKQACGEDVPKHLTRSEIRETLRMEEESRKQKRFTRRRIAYKKETFDAAIERAFVKLTEEEQFSVDMGEIGTLFSTKPRVSMKCKVKLLLLANLRSVVLALLAIGYVAYWRFKANRARRYEELVEKHYQETLELLRNHKNDFENKDEPHAFVKDVVLRAEILGDANERNIRIWKDVEKKIKRDARVMEGSRKVDGMPSYTYEWTGRRRGSGFYDGGSRRSSFGSRASLDSLDLRSEDGMVSEPASPWQSIFGSGGLQRA